MAFLSFRRNATVSGIGGWLAVLMFSLCAGLLLRIISFVADVSSYDDAWAEAPHARLEIAVIAGATILQMGVNLWAISALLQKKRSFRTAFLVFWIVSILEPLSALVLGFDMHAIVRALIAGLALGLWFLYVCFSIRVRNTLVN
ncbi:MAG: DUF2569 family protein [Enhydrobacter sp.]|nr:DUF2569 family protein [Enhydrobacter sp.]